MKPSPIVCAAIGVLAAAAPAPCVSQETPIAFVGATILPASGPAIARGIVVVQGGKIRAVGKNAPIPPGARRIDLTGRTVIPGLVDPCSTLFLSESDLAGPGNADRSVLDAADFFDDTARRVLGRGVTTLYLSPGRAGSVCGTGALVKLQRPDADGLYAHAIKPIAALKLTLGVSSGARSSSLERLASYEALRTAFRSTQQYVKAFQRYERDLKAWESGNTQAPAATPNAAQSPAPAPAPAGGPAGRGGGGRGQGGRGGDRFGGGAPGAAGAGTPGSFGGGAGANGKPIKPRKVPAEEVMAAALRGEIPVRVEAYRADDVLNALRLADEFKLKLVIERGEEAGGLTRELAARKAAIVWGPTLSEGAPRLDTAHHDPATAARLASAGLRLALATGAESGASSSMLLENAAAAAGSGLAPDAALRAVTLDAARILGVGERLGSIEPGKDADLVILSGSPWAATTRVLGVWVDGKAAIGAR